MVKFFNTDGSNTFAFFHPTEFHDFYGFLNEKTNVRVSQDKMGFIYRMVTLYGHNKTRRYALLGAVLLEERIRFQKQGSSEDIDVHQCLDDFLENLNSCVDIVKTQEDLDSFHDSLFRKYSKNKANTYWRLIKKVMKDLPGTLS
jgi:hypothetical protein